MPRLPLPLLAVIALAACKTRGVPEPPPERDPTRAEAPIPAYETPPDLLARPVYRPPAEPAAAGGHHQHHGSHGAAPKAGGQ